MYRSMGVLLIPLVPFGCPISPQDLKADPINTLLLFRFTLLHAIYMWLATVPIVTGALYAVLTPILTRLMPKSSEAAPPTDDKKRK
jgi:hypothetical protein